MIYYSEKMFRRGNRMIQYITFMKNNMKFTSKEITTNDLGSPHSLDEFEINVIDLSDDYDKK